MSTVDLDYLKAWVGRERRRGDGLDPFKANALARALDRADGLAVGDTLPPTWQWLYFVDTPGAAETGVDGHPKTGGFMPPVPLLRRMWAAGSFKYDRPLVLGEPAEQRSVITSIDYKEGKSGLLLFVTLDHVTTQAGVDCLHEQQTIVYREMPSAAAPLPSGNTSEVPPDWRLEVEVGPVLLFRYSALTYNGHRIHYDREYAVQREFYPALVVQGPLLATLLAEVAATHLPNKTIESFSFRAMRPAFDADRLFLCGRLDGNALELWTETEEGFIGMQVEAGLR